MRLIALAQAQLLDMVRNPVVTIFVAIIPVLGVTMKLAMPAGTHEILASLLFIMAPYFVSWSLTAQTLAEEKEKRQLEALFLTPVRPWQVVLVKSGLGTAVSLVFGLLIPLIMSRAPARPLLWFGAYLALTLFAVGFGTLMGLLFQDMRTLAVGGTPILLLVMFSSTMSWVMAKPGIWDVQVWLPTRPSVELLQAGYFGDGAPVLRHFLVMAGYIALLWLANARLVRRLSFAGR